MIKHLGRTERALGAALLLLAASQMSGCANHTWAPGPGAALPFGQASGQCKMAALDSHQGFVAIGNSNYVAGAAIGNGIGNAVRANATYNACMEAQGFIATDVLPVSAADIASTHCGGGPGSLGGGPGMQTTIRCGENVVNR